MKKGLFGRLLLIFSGLLISIILSFSISFHFFRQGTQKEIAIKNLKTYANYIANDIGDPPNTEIAKLKAKELGLKIGIFSNDMSFKSHADLDSFEEIQKKIKKKHSLKRFQFIHLKKSGYTYVFKADKSLSERSPLPLILGLFFSFLFVAIAYYLVNRLFKPLENIKVAAENYAQGDFEHKVPNEGVGLLKDLSISISDMGEKIQSMLDSKRELLLAIAHELRTPLTRAKLHIEFLEEGEVKNKLTEELNEMSQQVSDILQGEELKEGHKALELVNTNINKLTRDVIQTYFKDEPNINIKSEEQFNQMVDVNKFKLVIKNLISNAVNYGESKPIEIKISEHSISVIDQGNGISKEDIPQLTDPFFRVDKSRNKKSGGVGLGLYLVHQVLKAHGFELKITSDEKTEFKVLFSLQNK